MRISSRVHLIASGSLGCSLTHASDCNAYAVSCGTEYWLIDAGSGVDSRALLHQLKSDHVPSSALAALLVTHGHLDHSGGAAELHESLNVPVFASVETAAALESGDEDAISLFAAKQAGIYPHEVSFRACPVDRKLNGGESWQSGDCSIRVLRTPGHSQDMLTFLIQSPNELLAFAGDTVFHGGKILPTNTWDCQPMAYAQSLRNLAAIDIDGLYPGHGIWSIRDGAYHVRQTLPFLDRLLLPDSIL